eukprot:1176993-Prorocentrum_minimum.AAC.5
MRSGCGERRFGRVPGRVPGARCRRLRAQPPAPPLHWPPSSGSRSRRCERSLRAAAAPGTPHAAPCRAHATRSPAVIVQQLFESKFSRQLTGREAVKAGTRLTKAVTCKRHEGRSAGAGAAGVSVTAAPAPCASWAARKA